MMDVSYDGSRVRTPGGEFDVGHAVREAFELQGRIMVLLEPDALLAEPGYTRQRRRGEGALPNLLAFSPTGERLWEAAMPEAADYYYRIVSREPLVALSFSSWRCWLDVTDGSILRQEFFK